MGLRNRPDMVAIKPNQAQAKNTAALATALYGILAMLSRTWLLVGWVGGWVGRGWVGWMGLWVDRWIGWLVGWLVGVVGLRRARAGVM